MKKYIQYILVFTFTVSVNTLFAFQALSLSGKVTDQKTGESLPGVSIYFPDLKRGTTTDTSGNYRINDLPSGKITVNINLIGYAGQVKVIDLGLKQVMDIQLSETAKEIREIVVSGSSQAVERNRTPVPIMTMNKIALQQSVSTNIIDALATQPGIHQITTGTGISKPVIRGLGYNRVVVVNDGIRQEGQQWGDEHGIEVDEYSVDKIEVLKGPASLSYGSDALAGVVNFIPAQTLPEGKMAGNALFNYQTNNGLFGSSFNFRGNVKGFIWDARLSSKMAHSYKNNFDGYVYNTGFKENAYSLTAGPNKSWGYSHLTVSNYTIQPGLAKGERDSVTGKFLRPQKLNDSTSTMAIASPVELSEYATAVPFQKVRHFKLVSNSSFIIRNGTLKTTIGWQRNSRKEFTDVLHPDEYHLYFLLNTINYEARYILPEYRQWNISFGFSGMYQQSQNKGDEYLIPEYRSSDMGGFALFRRTFNKTDLSGGIRFDQRNLQSDGLFLDTLGKATAEGSLGASEKFGASTLPFSGVSASIGIAHQFTSTLYNKLNISRGFRAPNIAELKSNGEHEGTFRYEIGNPNFRSETSLQIDYVFGINTDHVLIEADLFANRMDNFIFLNKLSSVNGGDSITNGWQTFEFSSGKAMQQGGEIITDIHPHPLDWLHIMNSFAFVRSIQLNQPDSMKFLPFTPPAKYSGEIKLEKKKLTNNLRNGFIRMGIDHFFDQKNIYSAFGTETVTPGYTLLNASTGFDLVSRNRTVFSFYLSVNNITDKTYQSHLSRLKYAPENPVTGRTGIFNMGRNISIKLILPFGQPAS